MSARTSSHEHYEELAAGHALSALEPAEEQAFLAHLSGCAQCERDLAIHLETAAYLAHAVPAAEPPPSLLEGIRAGVRASAGTAGSAPVQLDTERARRRPPPRRVLAGVGAAAALALVVSLVSWNASLRHDQQRQVEASGRLMAAVRSLEGPGSRTVPLTSSTSSVNAVALLRAGSVSLVVDGLAPNDASTSTYVLWRNGRYGGVVPVGVFDVKTRAVDVVRDLPVPPGTQVQMLAVTLEKGRTAPAGATPPVIVSGTVA